MIAALAASLGVNANDPTFWIPLVFMGLLFLLIIGGVVLDGFDIGVGMLLPVAPVDERGRMMALLSPWRDANEFWPLLGIGLFAAAFPLAWGVIFGKLYGPLALMAMGMMLRSVSFEFRIRARAELKSRWVFGFWLGSLATAFGQGLILGRIATGYQTEAGYGWFSVVMGLCVVAAYVLLGAAWLVMRVDGDLQRRAARWGRHAIRWTAVGMVAASVMLGLANAGIFYKWSNPGGFATVAGVWAIMLLCFSGAEMLLARVPREDSPYQWLPFVLCIVLYWLMLAGLGYSLFPYLILDDMTLWDGTASIESMRLVLSAAVVGVPVVLVFNLWAYRSVFGKERRG
ncbi:cytochrome d ubiquinol oxidase subunit II [Bordetella genomosp. 4]|uniref:Cytochrome oxidase n=1 Tax=Bordetella genomosp. 4 TaxID=463044 RepID=A0A261UDQ2_9BORD|nr:cytochrome d ubiquinol oxidase subunit II [Bordetella genomosp. 4]OZI52544.1 cytochrome oxidase [Bordetella genomosp. 4]OZI59370.1 cytochrome oxidase [Bordetella genomosp. 4]